MSSLSSPEMAELPGRTRTPSPPATEPIVVRAGSGRVVHFAPTTTSSPVAQPAPQQQSLELRNPTLADLRQPLEVSNSSSPPSSSYKPGYRKMAAAALSVLALSAAATSVYLITSNSGSSGRKPAPPEPEADSSPCPTGTLASCIGLCPSNAALYQTCTQTCVTRCAHVQLSPPPPPPPPVFTPKPPPYETPPPLPPSPTSSPEPAFVGPLRRRLQSIIDAHSHYWNMSLSFAARGSSWELAVAAGFDDRDAPGSLLSNQTRIPMGSATKLYTAVSVLRLAEQGRLSLDDRVAPLADAYLSRYHGTTLRELWGGDATIDEVTFRQLLGMQSGVKDYAYGGWLRATTFSTDGDVTPLEYLAHQVCLRPTTSAVRGRRCHRAPPLGFRQMHHELQGWERARSHSRGEWLCRPRALSAPRPDHPPRWSPPTLVAAAPVCPRLPTAPPRAQDHGFLFAPGKGAAYSTNGYSLVGLALAGLEGVASWTALDQHSLAWPAALAFPNDRAIFITRGRCLEYEDVAHQYFGRVADLGGKYRDISNRSCLNSWMGGNLAARPLDAARFLWSTFSGGGLSQASIDQMLDMHPITAGGFGVGTLYYGLAMQASVGSTGFDMCGLLAEGHGGQDWGSGAPLNHFFPALGVGMSLAITSAQEMGNAGMNCSLEYGALMSDGVAANELIGAIALALGHNNDCCSDAPGSCDGTQVGPPPPPPVDGCNDEPSMGSVNGADLGTCATNLPTWAASQGDDLKTYCASISRLQMRQLATYITGYTPPAGFEAMPFETLCRGTCAAAGAGPCAPPGPPASWCYEAAPYGSPTGPWIDAASPASFTSGDCAADVGFGSIGGAAQSCVAILTGYTSAVAGSSMLDGCRNFFAVNTVGTLQSTWAPTYAPDYEPPAGTTASTQVIDLCRTTCHLYGYACQ